MGTNSNRPLGVTVLVVLSALQGLLLAAVGVVLVLGRDDPEALEALEVDSSTALAVGGALVLVVGLVQVCLALALSRGVPVVRSVYGTLATIQTASAVFSLIALRDVRPGAAWGLVFNVAVLWFLYGSEESEAFFSR